MVKTVDLRRASLRVACSRIAYVEEMSEIAQQMLYYMIDHLDERNTPYGFRFRSLEPYAPYVSEGYARGEIGISFDSGSMRWFPIKAEVRLDDLIHIALAHDSHFSEKMEAQVGRGGNLLYDRGGLARKDLVRLMTRQSWNNIWVPLMTWNDRGLNDMLGFDDNDTIDFVKGKGRLLVRGEKVSMVCMISSTTLKKMTEKFEQKIIDYFYKDYEWMKEQAKIERYENSRDDLREY